MDNSTRQWPVTYYHNKQLNNKSHIACQYGLRWSYKRAKIQKDKHLTNTTQYRHIIACAENANIWVQ